MTQSSDAQLLHDYATRRDETAFAILVTRYTNLVFSVALRHLESPDLAADVAQSVFVDLARKAETLAPQAGTHASLAGWLHRAAHYAALNLTRAAKRRIAIEQQAMSPLATEPSESAPDWGRLSPLLDEALNSLTEKDREALLLRFFQKCDFRAVGLSLGVSDDAAQKRVTRAVEHLRGFFSRRGITIGAGSLAAMISAHSVRAAPVNLALRISTAVSTVAASTAILTQTLVMTTIQKTLLGCILAAVVTTGLLTYQKQHQPDAADSSSPRSTATLSDSTPASTTHHRKGNPQTVSISLLKPRLDAAGILHLQQNPATILTEHAQGDGEAWSWSDDDLLVAWAAKDPQAALSWINEGERSVARSQLLGAIATGILLRDGKDAMRSFLDEHQQDSSLSPKEQGDLDYDLFLHLGRQDTIDAAMDMLAENRNERLTGAIITGIQGAQQQTRLIDYLEAKGYPVALDYGSFQEQIDEDPEFWATWANQRDSKLVSEILQSWNRSNPSEARQWIDHNLPTDDPQRVEIEQTLESPPASNDDNEK